MIMDVPKTSYHIQIKIKVHNPSLEPPVSYEAPNLDIKSMDVLCISQSRERAKNRIIGIWKTSYHIQIKIKIANPSQEPPASSKVPNEDFKDMDVLCTFKIKIESPNLDYGCVKDQWLYPNKDKDPKSQSGTSSVLQSPKCWLKGHGCSLHFQNQESEPKFGR